MKPLVIFGLGDAAQLAHFYFTNDTEIQVAAFAVDQAYLNTDVFCNLPVVAFETIETCYPASNYDFFIAVGYTKLNRLRAEKFHQAKAKGYRLVSYLSSKASVWPGLKMGENCFIFEDNTIQPFATIGDNVTLWSGNHIGHHSHIGDHCFITSHVVISGGVTVGENCFIGVNATLRDHISIGKDCVIGAGALILNDAREGAVYRGQETPVSPVPSYRLKGL